MSKFLRKVFAEDGKKNRTDLSAIMEKAVEAKAAPARRKLRALGIQQDGETLLFASGRYVDRVARGLAVVVNTMPMLRAGELAKIVDKAQVSLALCDTRLMEEIERFLQEP